MTGLLVAMTLFGASAEAGVRDYQIHQAEAELERSMAAVADDLNDQDEIQALVRTWKQSGRNSNEAEDAVLEIKNWLVSEIAEGEEEVMQARREVTEGRQLLSRQRAALVGSDSEQTETRFLALQAALTDDVADLEAAELDLASTESLLRELTEMEDGFGWRISKKEREQQLQLLRKIRRLSEQEVEMSVAERDEDRDWRTLLYQRS